MSKMDNHLEVSGRFWDLHFGNLALPGFPKLKILGAKGVKSVVGARFCLGCSEFEYLVFSLPNAAQFLRTGLEK